MIPFTKLLVCCFIFGQISFVFTKVGFKATITTWNVNEKPPIDNIEQVFKFDDNSDFYAVTLQEVNPKANPLSSKDNAWIKAISAVMAKNKYELVHSKSIDGSLTTVYSKNELKKDIKNADTSSYRAGALGLLGNKGATAVRFEYKNTAIVFVGSHFHAHDDQVQSRIEDFKNINNEATFKENPKSIPNHDVVFWSGDLNFRIDDLTIKEVAAIATKEDSKTVFAKFMAKDQLKKLMKEGRIFEGYNEGSPQFAPTYKYQIGTSNYNLERKPAYTDRVLYRLKSGNGRVISYTANTVFTISDHKPVTAVIAVDM